ncbi:Gamma-aminobutyric acid type B receptor subunit 1 [Orchesella cincta]|uniref:Gamma-aminobutyric acid type B receptor subunit 1 n=1 Tax=Orchesella cincta TaxID=48709 RepID=A0A1D2M6T6_ORCCI|nr:Gamma-aminobutyric acid type B receptor subunit 1 [Orchesella cincta]
MTVDGIYVSQLCSASYGMKAFFDMMNDTPLKYMLLGDACTQRDTSLTLRGWPCSGSTTGNALPEQAPLLSCSQQLGRLVGTDGVRVVAAQSFADDISYHIHKLKEKDAYRENLYGKKYQWLIVAAYIPTWWRKQDDVNCTVEEVETALKGALLMDLLPLSSSSDITISAW